MCDGVYARTTVTTDDDLAATLKTQAAEQGHSFKEVVNDLLRAGIAASGGNPVPRPPVTIPTKALGLKPGYDPDKLYQLVDELEVEERLIKQLSA